MSLAAHMMLVNSEHFPWKVETPVPKEAELDYVDIIITGPTKEAVRDGLKALKTEVDDLWDNFDEWCEETK